MADLRPLCRYIAAPALPRHVTLRVFRHVPGSRRPSWIWPTSPELWKRLSWLTAACGRRLITADGLRLALESRRRIRWRAELARGLDEIGHGAHSVLEIRYVRAVERPHGIPAAHRQARLPRGQRSQYLDNLYADFGVAVELDGQLAHAAQDRWRDIRRDNYSAALGIVTLRYSWADVTQQPCLVAAEVATTLRERGWMGRTRPCGPRCTAAGPARPPRPAAPA